MKLNGTHTKTNTDYMVRFSNGAAHRCDTMQGAIDFGKSMGETMHYGTMTEVYRITTTISKTYELVERFDVVGDEYEEDRDFEGFEL